MDMYVSENGNTETYLVISLTLLDGNAKLNPTSLK